MVAITAGDIPQAGKDPSRRRPEYSAVFPTGPPIDIIRGPIFLPGYFRSLGRQRGWVHGGPFEPLTEALNVAGDRREELHDFRT